MRSPFVRRQPQTIWAAKIDEVPGERQYNDLICTSYVLFASLLSTNTRKELRSIKGGLITVDYVMM